MAAIGRLKHTKIVITSLLVCRATQRFSNKYYTNRDNKTGNIYIKNCRFAVLNTLVTMTIVSDVENSKN